MPKAKTVKKTPATKTKTQSSKSSLAKMGSFNTKNFTISDLRGKVTDKKNRKSLIIAVIIILVAAALYLGRGLVIAATVNGQPVSRFAVITELEKQSGKTVLDNTITRMLVLQEAKKKKVEATQKDVDNEINKIKAQFKDQGQDFDALLAAQGLSVDKLRDEVKVQVLVTKILGDQAKVTDKEFNDFLSKNKDLIQAGEDQTKAKANLRIQLEQQKLAQKYQEWIQNVKKNAKINYFVNY